MEHPYETFSISPIKGQTFASRLTISNPPINLITYDFLEEFHTFLASLAKDPSPPKVLVISSTNPDFWIGHLDLHIASFSSPLPAPQEPHKAIHNLTSILHLFSTLSIIFIAEINGRAVAGGNEFALNMDMRFAGPLARFGVVEVGGGLIHVGALQQLTKVTGPGRAAEFMLGARGVDAREAERVGLVNRAFESEGDLRDYIDGIAGRIALFPRGGIEGTKLGIRECLDGTGSAKKDGERFFALMKTEETQFAIRKILERSNDMTLGEFELGLPDNIVDIWAKS